MTCWYSQANELNKTGTAENEIMDIKLQNSALQI